MVLVHSLSVFANASLQLMMTLLIYTTCFAPLLFLHMCKIEHLESIAAMVEHFAYTNNF